MIRLTSPNQKNEQAQVLLGVQRLFSERVMIQDRLEDIPRGGVKRMPVGDRDAAKAFMQPGCRWGNVGTSQRSCSERHSLVRLQGV